MLEMKDYQTLDRHLLCMDNPRSEHGLLDEITYENRECALHWDCCEYDRRHMITEIVRRIHE